MPFHRGFGKILLGVSVAQVLTGYIYYNGHIGTYEDGKNNAAQQGCISTLSCPDHMDVIFNFSVLSVILYAALVYTLISKDTWMRRPTPDEIKKD